MKKLFMIFALLFVIIGSHIDNNFSLKNYFSGEYYSYSASPANSESVNLGMCYMNNVSTSVIYGESMVIENFEPSSAIKKLKARIVSTEYLDTGATVIYAYSTLIPNKVKIEGSYVNLQIAYYENYSVIGWPLIIGSF